MKLMNPIRKFGEKIRLIRIDPQPGSNTSPSEPTKSITLEELTHTLDEARKKENSPIVSATAKEFAQIFEMMKLATYKHGWNVEKLGVLQQTQKDLEDMKNAIGEILRANDVPAEDIIRDARDRMQALDAFELEIKKKLEALRAVRQKEVEGYELEIQYCKEHVRHLKLMQSEDEAALEEWKKKKTEKVKEIQRLVSLIP